MSIDKLKERSIGLITFLKINDYSSLYIARFVREIQCIATAVYLKSISSYDEYYNYLTTDSNISTTTLVSRRQIIGKLQQYDLYGIYPSKEHPCFLLNKHPFDILSLEFQQAISYFSNNLSSRGLMQSTIDSRKGMFTKFLLTVQRNSIYCFSNISENIIHSYFNDGEKLIRGYDVVKIIRSALEINLTNPNSHLCIEQIIPFLPCIKKAHKIYPHLKDDEAAKILKAIMDEDVELSLRDRAITILLYFTGLRRGDIASMSLKDIDWEHNIIHVVQNKTGIKNVLPLRPVVGNALYDYIIKERPECTSNVVFLTNDRNPRPMKGGSIYAAVEKVFIKAKVRTNYGKKGTHIFRHNLARQLIRCGTETPVITQILGHTSLESINPYLQSDITALKQCALSIELYNMRREVFKI